MRFESVVGQDKIKNHLAETLRAGRTAHAQIFLGPEGSGQLAMALAYAQYLLCEDPGENDSCGVCNACKKTQKHIHPDLHFSYPTIGTGKISTDFIREWREVLSETGPYLSLIQWLQKLEAENQQGNITKNECVDIIRKFSFTKVEGRFKILVMWLPEFLDKEGNRLLKMIEEPEPDTVFILAAERQEKILNTILSRCQLVKLSHLKDSELEDALVQNNQVEPELARQIAFLSEGNYSKAMQLAKEGFMENNLGELFSDWLRVCYQGRENMVHWVEYFNSGKHPTEEQRKNISTGRKEQILFLQYGLFFIRELLHLKINPDFPSRLSDAEKKTAAGILKLLSLEKLEQITQLFNDSIYFVERNANGKILFMDLSLKIHRMFKPLSQIKS
jgi:DNA polymerase-3 subunit delta'